MTAIKLPTKQVNKQTSERAINLNLSTNTFSLFFHIVKMLHTQNIFAKKSVSLEMHYLLKALLCTHYVQENVRPIFHSAGIDACVSNIVLH